jgi:uncharacterized membrane protein
MGFWDLIMGDEKPSEEPRMEERKSTNPFRVAVSFSPYRLTSNKPDSVDLVVKVTNVSPETHLLSVDAALPKGTMLGFDRTCINKSIEKRVGELKAGQSVDVPITVWGNNQTEQGKYGVDVTVFSHFGNYDKVLSYAKKSTHLRSV